MTQVTEEFMREMLAKSKPYCVVILKAGPNIGMEGVRDIVWQHGCRNMELRLAGLLPIICRSTDDSDLAGIGIFNASEEEVRKIMDDDPGVKAGIFVYEVHPCQSFPGDSLPE